MVGGFLHASRLTLGAVLILCGGALAVRRTSAADEQPLESLRTVSRSTQVRATQLVRSLDRSEDGLLDAREAAGLEGISAAEADMSGDGLLSVAELAYQLTRIAAAKDSAKQVSSKQVYAGQVSSGDLSAAEDESSYADRLVEVFFVRFDSNRDGLLTVSEFDAVSNRFTLFSDVLAKGATRESLAAQLQHFIDSQPATPRTAGSPMPLLPMVRHDGFFTLQSPTDWQRTAARAIVRHDANSDGTLGLLEFMRLETFDEQPTTVQWFLKIDGDRDASLSFVELSRELESSGGDR